MQNTTVWAAQDYLFNLIDTIPEFAKITRSFGYPNALTGPRQVWVSGEVEDWTYEDKYSGFVARDESYLLAVHCLVVWKGGTYRDARDQLRDMATVIEDRINSSACFGGLLLSARIERAELEESTAGDNRSRAAALTLVVRCRATVGE